MFYSCKALCNQRTDLHFPLLRKGQPGFCSCRGKLRHSHKQRGEATHTLVVATPGWGAVISCTPQCCCSPVRAALLVLWITRSLLQNLPARDVLPPHNPTNALSAPWALWAGRNFPHAGVAEGFACSGACKELAQPPHPTPALCRPFWNSYLLRTAWGSKRIVGLCSKGEFLSQPLPCPL